MATTEDQASPYPGEVLVPEQTIPAHTIRATATPRALALMVGLIPLGHGTVDRPACDVTERGGAVWRLRHGFIVTLEFEDDGSAVWHLDTDGQSSERPADTPARGAGDAESHGKRRP